MLRAIAVDMLYVLALVNPISKIALLSGMLPADGRGQLAQVVRKSSVTAAAILLGAMFFGDFILGRVFHVGLHALRVAGGVVLFWTGFNALRKGVFFEEESQGQVVDLAIVPLACPLIAGPASITAAIALAARDGLLRPSISVVLAVLANAVLMRYTQPIAAGLKKLGILGALVRITGLIVMTIGSQMVLDGLAEWRRIALGG